MKITFEQVISRKTKLLQEILSSVTTKHFDTLQENEQEWDVKLLINGIETEPIILNEIWNDVERFIDGEAKELLKQKYEDLQNKIRNIDNRLNEIIEGVEFLNN